MKNNISDLNDHLFLQLERLNDEDLKGEALKTEIDRGKSVAMVAQQIIGGVKLTLDAAKLLQKSGVKVGKSELLLIYKKEGQA